MYKEKKRLKKDIPCRACGKIPSVGWSASKISVCNWICPQCEYQARLDAAEKRVGVKIVMGSKQRFKIKIPCRVCGEIPEYYTASNLVTKSWICKKCARSQHRKFIDKRRQDAEKQIERG